jgi:AcrR family transcriptional regulator
MQDEIEKTNQSQKILISAFECISTNGYANVSLRDIASEAGVALSQINYYFNNKEGLFVEVVKMMVQKYLTEVEERLKIDVNPKEKMSDFIMYFIEVLEEEPKLFKLLYDLTSMALWSTRFSNMLSEMFKDMADIIDKHILNSLALKSKLRNYNSRSLARIIFGAIFGISMQALIDPDEKELLNTLSLIELAFD